VDIKSGAPVCAGNNSERLVFGNASREAEALPVEVAGELFRDSGLLGMNAVTNADPSLHLVTKSEIVGPIIDRAASTARKDASSADCGDKADDEMSGWRCTFRRPFAASAVDNELRFAASLRRSNVL